MVIELHQGFEKLELCSELDDEQIEQVKEETVKIGTTEGLDNQYNFFDDRDDIICVINVDNDFVELEDLSLDESEDD